MPVPPANLAFSREYWESAARQGYLKARKKSGEIFPLDLSKTEIPLGGETFYVVTFRDTSCKQRLRQRVTELQRELLHLSRFTVLGELASAITHELNQPLGAITTYTAAARQIGGASQAGAEAGGKVETMLDILDKIAAQSSRAGDIIHKLRRLVNDRNIDRVFDDLSATVQEAVQLASMGAAPYGIKMSVTLPPQPVIILMDRSQILILVSNLVRNAIDELSTWRGERRIDVALTLPSADLAQLEVADTGPGIMSAVFERIFDPFHSTKPEGLGMGLALSRRIAEAHSGWLAAANRPGGGAVFTFLIPIGKNQKVGE